MVFDKSGIYICAILSQISYNLEYFLASQNAVLVVCSAQAQQIVDKFG